MGRIHPSAEAKYFRKHPDHLAVVRPFLTAFDVTYGRELRQGHDVAHVIYLSPEKFIRELLGLEREVLLTYAPYDEFQARTVKIHNQQLSNDPRLDGIASLIVTNSPDTGSKLSRYLESNPELPSIIGIGRDELETIQDADALRRVILRQAFRRNLFAIESPLRTDSLFFGRGHLRDTLIDRFRSGQNTGLFGLRRIGKTSVLYAVERQIESMDAGTATYIDLSNPSIYRGRWWSVLQQIVRSIAHPLKLERGNRSKILALSDKQYDEHNGASHFRRDVERLIEITNGRRILLLLDEIENITFDVSPMEHWHHDFLPLFQTLRATHQELTGHLCFILCGVNPHPLEKPLVGKHDNPLFGTVQSLFVPLLDRDGTREMVRRIGRYMGLRFDEKLLATLCEEYGGHPFLIRQACSILSIECRDRPTDVQWKLYAKNRNKISRNVDRIAKQILQVLSTWYPDEYELLRSLAQGDAETFEEYARESSEFVEHVEGYGLVISAAEEPRIRINLIEQHLKRSSSTGEFQSSSLANKDDILAEISRNRNRLENLLRTLIYQTFLIQFGNKAGARALECFSSNRREVLSQFSFKEIWPETYFNELIALIDKHWQIFQTFFAEDKQKMLRQLEHISKSRADAHARTLDEEELAYLKLCFRNLLTKLELFAS